MKVYDQKNKKKCVIQNIGEKSLVKTFQPSIINLNYKVNYFSYPNIRLFSMKVHIP